MSASLLKDLSLTFTWCLSRVWNHFIQTSRRHCSCTSLSLCSRSIPLLNQFHPLLTAGTPFCKIKPCGKKMGNLQNRGIKVILPFELITWRISVCEALTRERKRIKGSSINLSAPDRHTALKKWRRPEPSRPLWHLTERSRRIEWFTTISRIKVRVNVS